MSLLLLLNSSPAPQFTFVQQAWNSTAGGTPANTTLSLPSVGAGHLVCVSVEYLGASTGFTLTLTDGNGHSFTLTPNSPFQYSTLARYIWLGYILSAASGTMTITATPSVAHGVSIHAAEFSYTGTAAFDVDAGAFSTSGTTPINTPSITPTNPNALLYAAAIADPAGTGALTGVGSPWTEGTRGTIASDASNSGDAYILGASGAVPVSWTVGSSSATGWNAAAMAFNVTAAGALAATIHATAAVSSALLKGAGAALATIHATATISALLKGKAAAVAVTHGTAGTSALLKGKAAAASTVHGTATTSALIKGAGAVLATTHGAATTSAVLKGSGIVAAAAHATAAITSALLKGKGAVASVTHGVATASLTSVIISLAGVVHGTAGTSALLKGNAAVLATVHGASTTAALLKGKGAVATAVHGAASVSALLKGSGKVVATTHGTAGIVALLGGKGAALSTVHGVASALALLKGKGAVVASVHATATIAGTLRGSGAVASVAHGVASVLAMLRAGNVQLIVLSGARVIFALQPTGAHAARGITTVSAKAIPALAISGAKQKEAVTATGVKSGI